MGELLTGQELAKYLKLNPVTVVRKAARGEIPAIKVGRQFRFNKEQIDRWLAGKAVGRKMQILVVDDEPVVGHLFVATLQDYGYEVTTAISSTGAVELLSRQKFDLIFLDLVMPVIDGSELFRQIRQTDKQVPVAIITGYPNSDLMAKAMEHGPFLVMKKPFGSDQILDVVAAFTPRGEPE
ncbi:MAG: response regulator [Dehalococcoidia bacterium]|nr:response regulator [Dehalococcoidia bacterium]